MHNLNISPSYIHMFLDSCE